MIHIFVIDFSQISKTYDMDLDADLCRDNGFFTKKMTRYLCVSKEKSIVDYVLEDVKIISDKELPPEGYGAISKTSDTGTFRDGKAHDSFRE